MRKLLYGTAALVAGVGSGATQAQADGIELGLGGYMNTFFSFGSIDEISGSSEDYNPTGLWSDGEVHFLGSYKHDNGITFGVNVQLEMFGDANSGGDDIDEKYIYVEGDFGRVVAGSENSAAFIMQVVAPNVGILLNSGWITSFIPAPDGSVDSPRAPSLGTYLDYGNDENTLTYYTSRFHGFQLGISYTPSVVNNGDGKSFPVEADTEVEYSNGVSVGVNYTEEFGGFGVQLAGGYRRAEVSESASTLDFDDYQAWSMGASLTYAGFTLGGSFADEFSGYNRGGGALTSTEGQAWDVGVGYALGPWIVTATWMQTEVEGETDLPGEDKLRSAIGAVAYEIGPGIAGSFSLLWAEWEPEDGGEQSGVIGTVGLQFRF